MKLDELLKTMSAVAGVAVDVAKPLARTALRTAMELLGGDDDEDQGGDGAPPPPWEASPATPAPQGAPRPASPAAPVVSPAAAKVPDVSVAAPAAAKSAKKAAPARKAPGSAAPKAKAKTAKAPAKAPAKAKSRAKGSSKGSSKARDQVVARVAAWIREADKGGIRQEILEDKSLAGKVLLPLYAAQQEKLREPALTAHEIRAVLSSLDVAIAQPNVSKALRTTASKYVKLKSATAGGRQKRYALVPEGVTFVAETLAKLA